MTTDQLQRIVNIMREGYPADSTVSVNCVEDYGNHMRVDVRIRLPLLDSGVNECGAQTTQRQNRDR